MSLTSAYKATWSLAPLMATGVAETLPITRSQVPDDRRMAVLPHYAGQHYLRLEMMIYRSMEHYCQAYQGGYWSFWELSNGSFYMVPELGTEPVRMVGPGNWFDGTMSLDAAGIVACLVAFNHMSWSGSDQDRFIELFYGLRDWAGQHAECGSIMAAID